mmetsp:Transcript_14260/g.61083  ORF Transcript_14260/g.61083 Transcript_14260/m.61083 type:complete len:247 (+) Transcript_14260:1271-2011(+)
MLREPFQTAAVILNVQFVQRFAERHRDFRISHISHLCEPRQRTKRRRGNPFRPLATLLGSAPVFVFIVVRIRSELLGYSTQNFARVPSEHRASFLGSGEDPFEALLRGFHHGGVLVVRVREPRRSYVFQVKRETLFGVFAQRRVCLRGQNTRRGVIVIRQPRERPVPLRQSGGHDLGRTLVDGGVYVVKCVIVRRETRRPSLDDGDDVPQRFFFGRLVGPRRVAQALRERRVERVITRGVVRVERT